MAAIANRAFLAPAEGADLFEQAMSPLKKKLAEQGADLAPLFQSGTMSCTVC
jgi:hypothetical protein